MKAAINALTLYLMEQEDWRIPMPEAKAFAEGFFEQNAELFSAPPLARGGQGMSRATAQLGVPISDDPDQAIRPSSVFQPRQPGELMPHQQAAVAAGVQLCPNCQQPTNDHLPGCARVGVGGFAPMDPKARTKSPLPPAEA